MNSGANLIVGIIGMVVVAAFIGAFFAGFHIAGRSKAGKGRGYVLRGIFWSILVFFGGIGACIALLFGACMLIMSGMRF